MAGGAKAMPSRGGFALAYLGPRLRVDLPHCLGGHCGGLGAADGGDDGVQMIYQGTVSRGRESQGLVVL